MRLSDAGLYYPLVTLEWPTEESPPGIIKFIQNIRKVDPAYSQFIFLRRMILRRHCGERMYKISATDRRVSALVNFKACGVCGHYKQGWLFDDSLGVGP